jgi:hypothetical protein
MARDRPARLQEKARRAIHTIEKPRQENFAMQHPGPAGRSGNR